MMRIHYNVALQWSHLAGLCAGLAVCPSFAVAQQASGIGAATAAPVEQVPATGVAGVWIDHTGRGAIAIQPCGTRLCGYVSWVKNPVDGRGKPIVDGNNPDEKRRGKPLCGTRVVTNLAKSDGSGRVWGGGAIYNPEDGETYDLEVTQISPNRLSVHAYAGVKLFGETFTWSRAPADLVSCGPPRI